MPSGSVPSGVLIRRRVVCEGVKGSGSGPRKGGRGCGGLTEAHVNQDWVVVEHAVRKCLELVVAQIDEFQRAGIQRPCLNGSDVVVGEPGFAQNENRRRDGLE